MLEHTDCFDKPKQKAILHAEYYCLVKVSKRSKDILVIPV